MDKQTKRVIKYVVIGFIVLLFLITLFNSFKVVPTGYVGVKTQFGKVQNELLQEGLNIKTPFIEKVVLMDCRTKKLEVTSEGSTKDMQTVNITVVVNYNIDKATAQKLYGEVGTDYENIILYPSILESMKGIMAQYTAEQLITNRSEVSAMAHEALFNEIQNSGLKLTDFNITNIDFSEAYDNAIEAKAVKQQEVEAAKADLEKQKIQNEKEIAVAEKDAKVMELQNSQVTDKTLQLKALEIKEKMINKWNGQFPNAMLGENSNALFNMGN